MKIPRTLARKFADLIERTGLGHTVLRRSGRPCLLMFLYGRAGVWYARQLPDAEECEARCRQAGIAQAPRIVGVADESLASDAMTAKAHTVVQTLGLRHLHAKGHAAALDGIVKAQIAASEPLAVFATPEFAGAFPRIRRFFTDLRDALRTCDLHPDFPVPSILAPEVMLQFDKVERILEPDDRPMRVYYAGSPLYFDYAALLEDDMRCEAVPLGWSGDWHADRLPLDAYTRQHTSAPERRALGLEPVAPSEQRDIVLLMGDGFLRARMKDALKAATQTWGEADEAPQALTLLRPGGLLVSDAENALLPLLASGCRVALIRSPRQSPESILRSSYFLGQSRWPVFDGCRAFADALARDGVEGIWAPFEERTCSLQQEAAAGFRENFFENIYLPLARHQTASR